MNLLYIALGSIIGFLVVIVMLLEKIINELRKWLIMKKINKENKITETLLIDMGEELINVSEDIVKQLKSGIYIEKINDIKEYWYRARLFILMYKNWCNDDISTNSIKKERKKQNE